MGSEMCIRDSLPPTAPAQLDLPATQPGGSSTTSDGEGGFKGSNGRGVARRGGHTRLRLHDGQQDRVRPDEKRKKAISEPSHVRPGAQLEAQATAPGKPMRLHHTAYVKQGTEYAAWVVREYVRLGIRFEPRCT